MTPIPDAPAPAPARLTTANQAARAFRWLRWRLLHNTAQALLVGSRLRPS